MYNDLLVPNRIVYSNRKSIAIIIKPNGEMIVRVPKKTKNKKIDEFILSKKSWIIEKRQFAINTNKNKFDLQINKTISILGKNYQLQFADVKKISLFDDRIILPVSITQDKFIKFLKETLFNYIITRVAEISRDLNLTYKSISITSAKSNWGSCSFDNKLHFTYRLALCPKEVVDYLIVHELAHVKEKNHGAKFWRIVSDYMPNYKQYNKYLKDNKYLINNI